MDSDWIGLPLTTASPAKVTRLTGFPGALGIPQGFPGVAQLVMNLPAIWETWVQSLGWEDPLEKVTDTHSSILAWRTPWIV